MSMTDPIADLLTRIRNGQHASRLIVEVPASKFKLELVRIFKEQGYIQDYKTVSAKVGGGEIIEVELRYTEKTRQPVITNLQRISRPGRRVYADATHIPKVIGGMGTTILSTSKGVMTGHQARLAGLGGEVIAKIW